MSDEEETIGSIIGKAVTAMVVSLGIVGVMSATENLIRALGTKPARKSV